MERRVLTRLASGEPVKVSTLRTATAATLPVLAGLRAESGLRARRLLWSAMRGAWERFAVLVPEARLPALTAKQQAILAELSAAATSCRWPSCAEGAAFIDVANSGAARLGAHRRTASRLSPGRFAKPAWASATQ